MDIDLDDLHILSPARRQAKANNEIQARSDDQHHVRLFKSLRTGAQEGERVILWNDTASLWRGVEGNAGQVNECLECSGSIGPQNAATGQDEGAFGLLQEGHGFLDQLRIPRGPRLLRQIAWEVHLIEFHLSIQNIPRQIEIHRALLALRGHTDGLTDQLWNPPGVSDTLRPLGDGLKDGDLVHLLKRTPTVLGQRARATQGDDWRGIEEGITDAGE